EELPEDHGLSGSLDLGCDPQWIEVCHPTGGGVVRWPRPPLQTFNEARATFLKVLSSRYCIGTVTIGPRDIEILRSYLGADSHGLPADQIACAVIEKELKRLKDART